MGLRVLIVALVVFIVGGFALASFLTHAGGSGRPDVSTVKRFGTTRRPTPSR
jgi:hypothetical protein